MSNPDPAARDAVVRLETVREVAVITVDSPPVNTLSLRVRNGLAHALAAAEAGDAVAIVITCAGRTFIAGAEIGELGTRDDGVGLHDLLGRIENASKPLVVAIHGTALGGGLELALCAHARVAVADARLGFPEVKLGLLPGAGGTQRLPRLVKLEDALDVIVSGRHVPATEAARMGFVERIAPPGALLDTALQLALELARAPQRPLRVRDRDALLAEARARPGAIDAWRKANARLLRGPIAPGYNVRCVETALAAPDFEAGLRIERELFLELLAHPESAAQRHYFFAEREAARIPDVPADTATRPVGSVGVIGAGLMGGGIAMCFANAGLPVTIVEQKPEALERGLAAIRKNYDRTVASGRLAEADAAARVALIRGTLAVTDLAACDLVIEAVFERMDVKQQVFRQLDAVCKPGAILATNTSALDVDAIAAVTGRPQDVIGLHFFSPAHIMKLLEVVRGERTARDVIATAMKLAKKIGKIAVLSGVCPGFIGNRILFPRQKQAEALVLDGVMPWDVDRVLTRFGLPMGPFAMADMAGLDLGWVAAESRSATLREVMNEMGRHGQKSRAGYYDYDEERRPSPSPVTERVIREFAARAGRVPRQVGDDEILDRCLLPMINEGARILEEGKAIRASDIDVVWVTGYGWPVYRGGPMYYGDQLGMPRLLERLRELQQRHGAAFAPAPLVERLAAEGRRFADFRRP